VKITNPIKWAKEAIARWKYKRAIKAKLKKLKEKDPFIYD